MPTNHNSIIELLTPDELADMLKISTREVYRRVAQRRIRYFKLGRSLRFDKNDVMSYLQQNAVELVGTKYYDSKKD